MRSRASARRCSTRHRCQALPRLGLGPRPTRSRSISISPVTRTWRSASDSHSAFRSREISICPMWRGRSPNSGGWHISLSQWLRDYLYIPLGGNRGTQAETYRNLCLVFLACGLWHGANWTFVIWGVHHGVFLVIERAGLGRVLAHAPVWAARVYALAAVMSGWVWFRARGIGQALSFFASLAGFHGASGLSISTHIVLHPATIAALVIGTVLATIEFNAWRALRGMTVRLAQPVYALGDTVVVTAMFALSILSVAAGSYSPFLYFRF